MRSKLFCALALGVSALAAAASVNTGLDSSSASALSVGASGSSAVSLGRQIAPSAREATVGSDKAAATDAAYSVVGDSEGVTVLRATEKSGYSWTPLATLTVDGQETDRWISNWCLASGGHQLVVVYGTRTMVNSESMMNAGAWAAVVNVDTGVVSSLGRGYTMAYFNPSCGPNGQATLTAYQGSKTLVGLLDATTAKPVERFRLDGQVTSATPTAHGDVVAVTPKGIERFGVNGARSKVTSDAGQLHGLSVSASDTLTYVSSSATRSSVKQRNLTAPQSDSATLATGPVGSTDIDRDATGTLHLLGRSLHVSDRSIDVQQGDNGAKVSTHGQLVVNSSYVDLPVGATTNTSNHVVIDATATRTGKTLKFKFQNEHASKLYSNTKPRAASIGPSITPTGFVSRAATAGSSTDPVESERACSIARNDPNNQVLQPKPRQIEQAVNMAVSGILTSTSPTVQKTLGNISPQGMFPLPSLVGGGHVPSQLVLGVLAQESNLWQADKYTPPGSLGNALVGDYYGNRDAGSFWTVNFAGADCGYGVGQITDGMFAPGKQPSGGVAALPSAQQRAIALDYASNIAMATRMLATKWNEVASSGMSLNGGSSAWLENWYFAVWDYNTGFHPQSGSDPWGVGWVNNPINPLWAVGRGPFLQNGPADAAHPQDWSYPEKVMGFAAWSEPLTESVVVQSGNHPTGYTTTTVAGFNLAWWNSDNDRRTVKPASNLFCTIADDACDPNTSTHCTRSDSKCWWHKSVTWKDCSTACGHENVRFTSPQYTSSIEPDGVSVPGRCDRTGLPSGALVVDDVSNSTSPARPGCTKQTSQGSFTFNFTNPDANGSYGGKVDLHQEAGGFNDHFYFTHVRGSAGVTEVSGTWSLGQSLTNWTRVLVHVPSYAAWNPQAMYTISLGNGTSETRMVNQRRFANEWVSLGVFKVAGTPTVTLNNLSGFNVGYNDVAWDAVAFQPLSAKPTHFIVAMGDSFSSGEGATTDTSTGVSYTSESDHDGKDGDENDITDPNAPRTSLRNGCHRSTLAWSRQVTVSGSSSTVGARSDASDNSLDYHMTACSGAVSGNIVSGSLNQSGELPQVDQGYLDANTTLVTISIGGNDVRFADVAKMCINSYVGDTATVYIACNTNTLPGDSTNAQTAQANRFANVLPGLLTKDLAQIHAKAPNAKIVLMGYPKLFETGSTCVLIDDRDRGWLNSMSDSLKTAMANAASAAQANGISVKFVDPEPYFTGHNLCTSNSAENGLITTLTPGDKQMLQIPVPGPNFGAGVSQQSIHPNTLGVQYYASALQNALTGYYP